MEHIFTADGQHLIFAGALLFVIGLFGGVMIPAFKNRRMGLSAHLAAVQSGTAVIVFGLIWSLVDLSPALSSFAKWSLIAGNYLIWFGIVLAAITGASKALPIAGEGYSGNRGSEQTVMLLEMAGVVLSLISGVLIIWGLANSTFTT